jgi:hypothetical protein
MTFAGLRSWAGLGLAAVALTVVSPAADAQKPQMSDKTVLILMDYAWALTPAEFTTQTGKIIRVNKDKFEEVKLPLDDAREVIRVARISGQAQICEMGDAQTANYETLMEREAARGKWTDQQLVFINKLHLFTVMTMTGQVKATDPDAPAAPLSKEPPANKASTCTDEDRKRIGDQVVAYVNAGPAVPAKDAPAKDAPAKSAPAKAAPAKK